MWNIVIQHQGRFLTATTPPFLLQGLTVLGSSREAFMQGATLRSVEIYSRALDGTEVGLGEKRRRRRKKKEKWIIWQRNSF